MQKHETQQRFEIDMVIDYVSSRVRNLVSQINDNRLTDSFKGATAGFSQGSDGGFSVLGTFLFDAYMVDAIGEMADAGLQNAGVTDQAVCATPFNNAVVIAMDAYSMLSDDENTASYKLNGVRAYYPKGRNRSRLPVNNNVVQNFNRASNQNSFYGNPEGELNALMGVLQSLEALASVKLRDITLEHGQSIASKAKKLHKSLKRDGGFDIVFGGLRQAI